jgi:PAS domain-containing protein
VALRDKDVGLTVERRAKKTVGGLGHDKPRDVTERRRAEEAVRESEERFRLIADTAPALIWMAGTDKLCTYFNKPWLDFTGRSIDLDLGNGSSSSSSAGSCRRRTSAATDRSEISGSRFSGRILLMPNGTPRALDNLGYSHRSGEEVFERGDAAPMCGFGTPPVIQPRCSTSVINCG